MRMTRVNAEINKSKKKKKTASKYEPVLHTWNKDTDWLRSHVYGSTNKNHWKSEITTKAFPIKSFRMPATELQSYQWKNE